MRLFHVYISYLNLSQLATRLRPRLGGEQVAISPQETHVLNKLGIRDDSHLTQLWTWIFCQPNREGGTEWLGLLRGLRCLTFSVKEAQSTLRLSHFVHQGAA